MKQFRRTVLAAAIAAAAWSMSVFAAVQTEKAAPADVTLTTEGYVSWAAPTWEGVDRYEVQILKGEDPATAKEYRTYRVNYADETSYDARLNTRGYFYARVRAYDVSGNYTAWSAFSDKVTVTTEDLRNDGPVVSVGNPHGGPGNPSGQRPGGNVPGGSANGGPGSLTGGSTPGESTTYGWQQNGNGRWYRRVNGTYPANQWEKIDGIYYHFDQQGYMQTGWIWETANSSWYYCLPEGKLATGWNNVNEKWYYMDPNTGIMYAGGIHLIDGKYYCMDEKGARITNAWSGGYYYGADGVRVS